MKTRKYGVNIALAAVLLLAAVLTSCPDPLDTVDLDGYSPEQGYIQFNFGEEQNSRTIMPTAENIAEAQTKGYIVRYEVTITDGTSTVIFGPSLASPNNTTFTTLSALTSHTYPALTALQAYTIKVDAYTTWVAVGDSGNVLAATGTHNIVSAVAGPNDVTIALGTLASGAGTFSWNLTYAGTNTFAGLTATMNVYTSLTGTTRPASGDFSTAGVTLGSGTSVGSGSIPAGTYYVKVSLTGATGTEPATHTEILQIYPGLTSAWEDTGGAPHNFPVLQSNSHTVTLNNPSGVSTTAITGSVGHGSELSTGSGGIDTYFGTGTAPAPSGYIFGGWFPSSGLVAGEIISSAWDISARNVFRPQTFYAKWDSSTGSVGTWDVTFSLVDVAGSLTLSSGLSNQNISSSGLETGSSNVTLTIDEASLSSPTYNWLYNGAPLPSPNLSNSFVFGYSPLNLFTENYLRPGIHTITLILVSGGTTYSANFTINVQNN